MNNREYLHHKSNEEIAELLDKYCTEQQFSDHCRNIKCKQCMTDFLYKEHKEC